MPHAINKRDCKTTNIEINEQGYVAVNLFIAMCYIIIVASCISHYLLESRFSSEISKNGMRAGGSLPLSIIHILNQEFVK